MIATAGRYLRLSGPWPVSRSTASWPSAATSWSRSRSRCSGWASCSPSTGRCSDQHTSPTGRESEYFFFVGCFFAIDGLIETLFLENCNEFADLVRTGDLDFLLLKPIDEQFLISCGGSTGAPRRTS